MLIEVRDHAYDEARDGSGPRPFLPTHSIQPAQVL